MADATQVYVHINVNENEEFDDNWVKPKTYIMLRHGLSLKWIIVPNNYYNADK